MSHKNKNMVWLTERNGSVSDDLAKLAVLMDIRDELQKLNKVFACHNTIAIPNLLRKIVTSTNRIPRKKRKK